MPGQNIELEQQKNSTIKLLKMEPHIPQNRSAQHLVGDESSTNETTGLRSVTLVQWSSVCILCFVNLINYMDRFTVAGILPDIQKTYDVDDTEGGLLQTVFILSYMIFAPLFGYLGDRYSRKLIMAFGVFLWSLTTLLGSFMDNFWLFLMCRAMVGIGEASYSTVAPTIISDLFVKDLRSKMLALFYFAIPVGSGLGYIIGSVTASAAGSWQWGLRVTPILGGVAVLLILIVLRDPQRGQSEGGEHMTATSYFEDLRDISRNRSFILSTAGFTCVAFVAGALSWWGPTLLYRGVKLQPGNENVKLTDLSLPFGGVAMAAGIVGVTLGCFLSQWLVKKYPRADPQICAVGLLVSTPLLVGATFASTYNTYLTFVLLFFGEVALNLNWSLVCDILLYVVIPTRRSTAQGFQLLVSHALGDAGSPYFVGLISVALKSALNTTSTNGVSDTGTSVTNVSLINRSSNDVDTTIEFKSLQYAVFTTSFVEVLGGVFFLLTAIYVVKDKLKVEKAVREALSTESVENIPDMPKSE